MTAWGVGCNLRALGGRRRRRHAGNPLHHASKEGLKETVSLLLAHGANALIRNDDCQTPLDVARLNGHSLVVRLIENHICYFSGWVRQIYGPGFLELVAQRFLTRNICVVVLPSEPNNVVKPLKLELFVHSTFEDAQPSMVIHLWKSQIEQPNIGQLNPTITIFDDSTKSQLKLSSGVQGDKRQILSLYDACRGVSQVVPLQTHPNTGTSVQDAEVAMPSNDSVPTIVSPSPNSHQFPKVSNTNGWEVSTNNDSYSGWGGSAVATTRSEPNTSGWLDTPGNEDYNGWTVLDSQPLNNPTKHTQTQSISTSETPVNDLLVPLAPSAPPILEELLTEEPLHYPSIDPSTDAFSHATNNEASSSNGTEDEGLCVICWEAPNQGACIPCGHMAGCVSCLTKIKDKKGVCPVCRSQIDQVLKVYAV